MVEQPAIHSVEDEHKSHGRRLHGARLWLARGFYIVLFSLVLTLFIIGFQAYVGSWSQGNVGAMVTPTAEGELVLYVYPAGDAASAGVKNGDTLQEVNGNPVTTASQTNQLLVGKIGDPVTLTVLTSHQFPRQVKLTFGGEFLQLLANMQPIGIFPSFE